ncbi:MAD-domain-containing protein [Auriscalpium vulgare]|uniref:MAD-domain-containing protein n=1 Tax=Auriscalpium vulgare TaxID=40419 RepID=A0ACB8SA13_9AGAM|nr:MAD-domain-containing protein [Auriscalpium vulgare]
MNSSNFSTPLSSSSRIPASVRTTASKRDSLAAELERDRTPFLTPSSTPADPHLSSAKRQQRSQAFTSTLAHASVERQLVAAHTAKMELESKLREKDITIERLEGDRRWLAEREKEEREEKEREQTEREEEKREADQELRRLRNALATLQQEHADLKDTHATFSRASSKTIDSQKAQLSAATRQTLLLDDELRELRRVADARSHTVEELQSQLDNMGPAPEELERRSLEDKNWGVLRDELQRQAGYVRKLEAMNARMSAELTGMRERNTSIEVLREEKRGLERKVLGVSDLRERVFRLEAELQAARKEREEWASKAARTDSASETPVSVTQSLTALRLTHARLLEEHGSTTALLRQRESELADALASTVEARAVIEQLQQSARSAQDKIARLERAAVLADREIGFLQTLNASYVSEALVEGGDGLDTAKEQHIKELELLVDEYKSQNREMQAEIEQLEKRPPLSDPKPDQIEELEKERQAAREAQKALAESEAATEQHLEKIETLEQTLFELRGEIGAGHHVPPGVRILSMKENPAQEWFDLRQAALDRLKGENDALLKRLADLETQGVHTTATNGHADLIPRESLDVVSEEKRTLEDALKQKEKQMLRLRQVFTAKSAEFREAIGAIMGVKLAFQQNGTVRVTSQYDLNAAFVFQPTSRDDGARMQLIAQGEGGPEELPQLMRNWVEIEQSIPCFLASVTLGCYETWKRNQEEQGES